MNIEIQKTKKNSALLRAMASDDIMEAFKARQAFAAYITEPVQQLIEAAPVLQQLFTPYSYEYGTPAMIPLAPLFDVKSAGFIRVWVQSRAGGLATSQNVDSSEFPVSTYAVEGAVSLPLSFVRAARVDVLAAYLEHLAGNFLVKSEVNRATVLCNMAASTTYQLRGTATKQVYRTLTQGQVVPQDLNAVNRMMARINTATIGGTPAGASRSVTHLVGSPEFVETVRNMAWEPLNAQRNTYPLGGPDAFRNAVYDSSGDPTLLGAKIITLNDLGINQPYNIIFADAAGVNTFAGYAAGTAVVFSPGSEQVVFAIDRKVKSLATLTEQDPDSSVQMKVLADNQWSNRAEEIGFYAKKREGHAAIDGRGCVALVF